MPSPREVSQAMQRFSNNTLQILQQSGSDSTGRSKLEVEYRKRVTADEFDRAVRVLRNRAGTGCPNVRNDIVVSLTQPQQFQRCATRVAFCNNTNVTIDKKTEVLRVPICQGCNAVACWEEALLPSDSQFKDLVKDAKEVLTALHAHRTASFCKQAVVLQLPGQTSTAVSAPSLCQSASGVSVLCSPSSQDHATTLTALTWSVLKRPLHSKASKNTLQLASLPAFVNEKHFGFGAWVVEVPKAYVAKYQDSDPTQDVCSLVRSRSRITFQVKTDTAQTLNVDCTVTNGSDYSLEVEFDSHDFDSLDFKSLNMCSKNRFVLPEFLQVLLFGYSFTNQGNQLPAQASCVSKLTKLSRLSRASLRAVEVVVGASSCKRSNQEAEELGKELQGLVTSLTKFSEKQDSPSKQHTSSIFDGVDSFCLKLFQRTKASLAVFTASKSFDIKLESHQHAVKVHHQLEEFCAIETQGVLPDDEDF